MALLERIQIDERAPAPTAEQANRLQTNFERALKRLSDTLTALITSSSSGGGAGASVGDAFVTIGHPADLTAERALTGSPTILVLDGGANNQVTLSVITAGLGLTEADIAGLVADLAGKVSITRRVNTASPLAGGGALSADLNLTLDDVPDLIELQRQFRLLLKRHIELFRDIPPGLEDEVPMALATD